MSNLERRAHEAALRIWGRLERTGFSGWDPYDALAGRRVPEVVRGHALASRVLLQAVKRCPVPLQPLLGVPRAVSAYTLGHALLAVARLGRLGLWSRGEAAAVARVLADSLWDMRSPGVPGAGWGYHFPFRSRFTAYSAGVPNIIVTAFVAKGLSAVQEAELVDTGDRLRQVCRFVLHGLARTRTRWGQRFGYLPGYGGTIHNANALAILVLAESGRLLGDSRLIEEASSATADLVAHQRPDGSWPYSEDEGGMWVDGYHTGFVLEGLGALAAVTHDAGVEGALRRGLAFYAERLFGPGGEPYYTPQRRHPYDALSAAEGLEALGQLGAWCGVAVQVRRRLLEWTLEHMVDGSGRVAFQVHRGWTDWREFPRWSAAPMCAGLLGGAAEVTQ